MSLVVDSSDYGRVLENVRYCLCWLKKLLEEWQQTCSESTAVLCQLCELTDKVLVQEKDLSADGKAELETILQQLKAGIIQRRASWTIKRPADHAAHLLKRLSADKNFVDASAPLNLHGGLKRFVRHVASVPVLSVTSCLSLIFFTFYSRIF